MSRMIVVSNRVPLPDKDGKLPAGGLAVAVHAALQEEGGIWFGWSGQSGEEEPGPVHRRSHGAIDYVLTDLSSRDVDEYYSGFANRVLWPLFHCRIDLAEYSRRDKDGYFRVNRLFADRLMPLIEPDDIIWVHDYHLIPLAAELRRRGVKNRIGFFLHIPWPPADILFAMPIYDQILKGLSSYDLVGFQTDHDLDNYISCLIREGVGGRAPNTPLAEAAPAAAALRAYGRTFQAATFPIGIETAEFARLAAQSEEMDEVQDVRRSMNGRDLIIGVDRLDYSKGIPERILAFERFLELNPDRSGHVTLLQIAPSSRSEVPEYRDMQATVESLAGRVNGTMGRIDWTPIRYINQGVAREALAGLYRQARVGLVTPLRDGMNLVAKEYVAAQDPDDPGVLVLSRFAGAARGLRGAVLCNPHDSEQTARAMEWALTMTLEERRSRWRDMMDYLLEHDIGSWCRSYLAALSHSRDHAAPSQSDT
ncbi:alpha,alpha-trehalose-phosphate synthase (UDP-forming) [Falsirhodobacter halotolerans]|uniref:alpha,alpha-trehalose-phosphate synthase (UDP-forming) n=1 Tax=Falsirhodobacter halotolerans TaxID=1146892 RepID=UPI001FD3F3BB|nr:alpha,alpha-trehalose-phosphate synthase (UDP-forming) [Falsirhodobacter halotolerans]MCJ8138243.1 alpha,alpha-trehalose-phosphate synthase (UDP-forming) [Falsirhodobacter halotolerans]